MTNDASIAYQLMQDSAWSDALHHYKKALVKNPTDVDVLHNTALCHLALSQLNEAITIAQQACQIAPQRDASLILIAKAYHQLRDFEQAFDFYGKALDMNKHNADAIVGLADLYLNQFGYPEKARELVTMAIPKNDDAKADFELTRLMCTLYEGNIPNLQLNQQIKSFSSQYLDARLQHPSWSHASQHRSFMQMERVGLLSPFFSVSPVFFLTFSFFRTLSKKKKLIILNRGNKSDWATEQFRSIAAEWIEVQHLNDFALSECIYQADVDCLYDLGGWSDPIGLKALSLKPARQQYKWVGGQSATTGLSCFDGWIGDSYQSPTSLQSLYTEPIVNFVNDYAWYTPPTYMPAPIKNKRQDAVVIFANPAKISSEFLQALKNIPAKKVFLHRQFQYPLARQKIIQSLDEREIEFITPASHAEALQRLNQFSVMIDTYPYSGGLTAREAKQLGLKIMVLKSGLLFCQRHSLRYI
jgi:protein O-GlcNAc transferase